MLATAAGGVADRSGIRPGDVLEVVGARRIASPADLDTVAWYWITTGVTDFPFATWRRGETVEVYVPVSEEYFWGSMDVTTVETWESWSSESFSCDEYHAEHSETLIEKYESSETMIENAVSSEELASEMSEERVETSEDAELAEAAEEQADDGAVDEEEEGGE